MTESKIVNEWIRQGEVKGKLSQARKSLLRLLERKFARLVPQEVARFINQQESLQVFDRWIDEAIAAKTVEEFTAALRR